MSYKKPDVVGRGGMVRVQIPANMLSMERTREQGDRPAEDDTEGVPYPFYHCKHRTLIPSRGVACL